jgi:hypothetical protein
LDNFSQMAQDWAGYFSAMAQVSGGLVGLVFVALTFNPKALGAGGDPVLGTLARQTFSDFLILLLVSMLMLAPHVAGFEIGLILLLAGAVTTLRILITLPRAWFQAGASKEGWTIASRFLLSALGRGMIGAAGYVLLSGNSDPDVSGSALLSGTMLLVISGCRSAWMLVLQEGKSPPTP